MDMIKNFNKKTCPIKFLVLGTTAYCDETCAWWNVLENECCINSIAAYITFASDEITFTMRKTKSDE